MRSSLGLPCCAPTNGLASRVFLLLALSAYGVGAPPNVQAQATSSDDAQQRSLRPLHDFGGAVLDFGKDTWAVVSAPARLDGRGWAKMGLVLGGAGLLYLVDDEIRDGLADSPSSFRSGLRDVGDFLEPIGMMGNTNAYYAGAATLAYFARQERLQLLFKELLYSHWIAGATRQSLGRLVGRVRPKNAQDASTFEPGEGRSFPSGHSSTIMQVAHVLAHHLDSTPASVALYGLAATVVFQRVDSEEHWASDAFVGAAWGLAVAEIVIRKEEEGRLPAGARVDLVPSRSGLTLRFSVPIGQGPSRP